MILVPEIVPRQVPILTWESRLKRSLLEQTWEAVCCRAKEAIFRSCSVTASAERPDASGHSTTRSALSDPLAESGVPCARKKSPDMLDVPHRMLLGPGSTIREKMKAYLSF